MSASLLELAIIAEGFSYQHPGADNNVPLPPGFMNLTTDFNNYAATLTGGLNAYDSSTGFQGYVIGYYGATDSYGLTIPGQLSEMIPSVRGTDTKGTWNDAINNAAADANTVADITKSAYGQYADGWLSQTEQLSLQYFGVPVMEVGQSLGGLAIEAHAANLAYVGLTEFHDGEALYNQFNIEGFTVFNPLSGANVASTTFGISNAFLPYVPVQAYISSGDTLANNMFTPSQIIGENNTLPAPYGNLFQNHIDVISEVVLLDQAANGGVLPAADARDLRAVYGAADGFRPGTPQPIQTLLDQYNSTHPDGSYYVDQSAIFHPTTDQVFPDYTPDAVPGSNPFNPGGQLTDASYNYLNSAAGNPNLYNYNPGAGTASLFNNPAAPDPLGNGGLPGAPMYLPAVPADALTALQPEPVLTTIQSIDTYSYVTVSGDGGPTGGDTQPAPPPPTTYPVVLDLNGNGIKITPLSSSNMFFDMANDGYAQKTAWAGPGNGVLVYDPGGGPVTQANQVDFKLWDPSATSDMQALEEVFDSNHDGVLNSSDASWSDFYVLVTNADGTTTLETMAQAGVTSINLTPNSYKQVFTDGASIQGETTFTRSDGTVGTAATVTLKRRPATMRDGRTARQRCCRSPLQIAPVCGAFSGPVRCAA